VTTRGPFSRRPPAGNSAFFEITRTRRSDLVRSSVPRTFRTSTAYRVASEIGKPNYGGCTRETDRRLPDGRTYQATDDGHLWGRHDGDEREKHIFRTSIIIHTINSWLLAVIRRISFDYYSLLVVLYLFKVPTLNVAFGYWHVTAEIIDDGFLPQFRRILCRE